MPHHHCHLSFPYKASDLFALVADIEKYPDFLPGVQKVTPQAPVYPRNERDFFAQVEVGHSFFQDAYQCRIQLFPVGKILVEASEDSLQRGPLKTLQNYWKFKEKETNATEIEFFLDFELRNPMLNGLVNLFFADAIEKFIQTFQKRAHMLYGT